MDNLARAFVVSMLLVGCGGSTQIGSDAALDTSLSGDAAGTDAIDRTAPDVAVDVAMDATIDSSASMDVADVVDSAPPIDAFDATTPTDVAAESTVDSTATDTPRTDSAPTDAAVCSATTGCSAYWCGCGACDPSTITCQPGNAPSMCPRGCIQSCPQLRTAVCSCNGTTCSAPQFPDAGSGDAAVTDGGVVGTACTMSTECASGLLCCYPCGIPGCQNRCTVPMNGRCPLIP